MSKLYKDRQWLYQKYVIDEMKGMDLTINNSNCPDCVCNIVEPTKESPLLSTINKNIIQLQNKEVFETPTVVYYIEEYTGNCSNERQVRESREAIVRIEKEMSKSIIKINDVKEIVDNIEDDTFDIKQDMTNLFKLD